MLANSRSQLEHKSYLHALQIFFFKLEYEEQASKEILENLTTSLHEDPYSGKNGVVYMGQATYSPQCKAMA